MGAVTYPNAKTIKFVEDNVIPIQLKSDVSQAKEFNVKWTPNILVLDSEGIEHHRIIGFLPPAEFIASVHVGIGKAYFDLDRLEEAIAAFDAVINEFPYCHSAPEAIYFRGVALYKNTHQVHHLNEAYKKLQTQYPHSEWAKRASPYFLL